MLTSQDNFGSDSRTDENDSGDESDDSMMDTSVPMGLGESLPDPTQSTQAEQEMTSSGPSLPAGAKEHVQVAVTPVTENIRLHGSKLNDEQSELGLSHSALSSSQANKMSSQSRILDTYPHHGSHEKSQSSHEDLDPSSLHSEDGSLRIDVIGTQTQNSISNELSQGATPSQEIVLDSSGPAQRHQDISLSGPESANKPSSLQFGSPRESAQSQSNRPTQDSMKENLSQDGPASSHPRVSPTRHSNTAIAYQEQEQNILRGTSPPRDENPSQALNTQSAAVVARRMGHICNQDVFAEAKEAYRRFCDDYSVYTGDFNHFTEVCSKLQAVRAQGQLQRSYLWDDFIIMHLLKYPSHIEERASQGSRTLSYGDYFCSSFTHPFYKKRSLTAHGIDRAASQFFEAERTSQAASSQVQGKPSATLPEATNESFTTSLVTGFSNFHAHSFNEVPQSSLPDAAEPTAMPISQPSTPIKQEGDDMDFEEMTNIPKCSMNPNEDKDEKPALSSLESTMDQNACLRPYTANTQDDGDISMDEIEETDLEDNNHETASVELGDDDPVVSTVTPSRTNAVPEAGSESESENENWFVSLRRMRPTSPVWSDDPHTPFKRWAEADQNVLTERLRRGRSRILLDEKGVIRRGIHR